MVILEKVVKNEMEEELPEDIRMVLFFMQVDKMNSGKKSLRISETTVSGRSRRPVVLNRRSVDQHRSALILVPVRRKDFKFPIDLELIKVK